MGQRVKLGSRLGGFYLSNMEDDTMNDGHERKTGASENGNANLNLTYDQVQHIYSQHFEGFKAQVSVMQQDGEMQQALMAHAQRLGIEMPRLDIASLTGEVCKDWPKIKGFLGFAISLGVFWPGVSAIAAGARAFIALVDTQLIPGICKV